MAYASGNPKTKKALKEMVNSDNPPYVLSAGFFPATADGTEFIEGPHYPEPHRFYAQVKVQSGVIVKVIG